MGSALYIKCFHLSISGMYGGRFRRNVISAGREKTANFHYPTAMDPVMFFSFPTARLKEP